MTQTTIRNPVPPYPAWEERARTGGSGRYVNVGEAERFISGIGGGLLALYGLRRGSIDGWLLVAAGGVLLYRGLTGHCPVFARLGVDTASADQHDPVVEVREVLTVYAPRSEVYARWRDLEKLPLFMRHLASVEVRDERRSHWTARIPRDMGTLSWDAEVTEDVPSERISWRSLPDADVDNAGTVHFEDDSGGQGTRVHVELTYRPPAGFAGAAVARLLNPAFSQMIKEDIRRFRSYVEAGEVPTIEGQPDGR